MTLLMKEKMQKNVANSLKFATLSYKLIYLVLSDCTWFLVPIIYRCNHVRTRVFGCKKLGLQIA